MAFVCFTRGKIRILINKKIPEAASGIPFAARVWCVLGAYSGGSAYRIVCVPSMRVVSMLLASIMGLTGMSRLEMLFISSTERVKSNISMFSFMRSTCVVLGMTTTFL